MISKAMTLVAPVVLMMAACTSGNKNSLKAAMKDPKNGLVQEKRIGGTVVKLTYLPECWERMNGRMQEADHDEMCFKINVFPVNEEGEKKKQDDKRASFGLDTVFQLVLNHDTLKPLQADRVANGNARGIEYLVIFERKPLEAVQQAVVIYKDWLFTSTRLVFPMQKKYIQLTDSLSCRL